MYLYEEIRSGFVNVSVRVEVAVLAMVREAKGKLCMARVVSLRVMMVMVIFNERTSYVYSKKKEISGHRPSPTSHFPR
jgi:hypothetical protein